ncbi:hypothetical protein [Petrimonas sp.]|uniref:hypothetical protein n=1 Tax=Petrimonas sp. TaxID=2023866 RepID=UPI003FA6D5F9
MGPRPRVDETTTFNPYYAWDNRDAGQMKVWVDLSAQALKSFEINTAEEKGPQERPDHDLLKIIRRYPPWQRGAFLWPLW